MRRPVALSLLAAGLLLLLVLRLPGRSERNDGGHGGAEERMAQSGRP